MAQVYEEIDISHTQNWGFDECTASTSLDEFGGLRTIPLKCCPFLT